MTTHQLIKTNGPILINTHCHTEHSNLLILALDLGYNDPQSHLRSKQEGEAETGNRGG